MNFKFNLILLIYCLPLISAPDLSSFSVKNEGLMLKAPKIWNWKLSEEKVNNGKIFVSKNRKNDFKYIVLKFQNPEIALEVIKDFQLEIVESDLKIENLPIRFQKVGILRKYHRKKYHGYILEMENHLIKYCFFLESIPEKLEAEKSFVLEILSGIEFLN